MTDGPMHGETSKTVLSLRGVSGEGFQELLPFEDSCETLGCY